MIEYLYLVFGLLGGFAFGLITLVYYARKITALTFDALMSYYIQNQNITLDDVKGLLDGGSNDKKQEVQ